VTGTSLIDAIGVAIIALCGAVFGLVLIATVGVYVAAVVSDLRGTPAYDQRDHSRSPDWPD